MLRKAAWIALVVLSSTAMVRGTAVAQSGVVTVNGEAITSRDVEQRAKVSAAVYRRPQTQAQALQELIDDKIKLSEGRRIGLRLTPAGIDEILTRMASGNRQTLAQFEQNLTRAGVDPDALRAKVNADSIWNELLRQRARSGSISNAELNAELERRVAKGDATVTDYVLRQIIFVVPRDSNPGQREREANAARGRFADCDAGVEFMRSLRDVAVKERVGRISADLPEALNTMLKKTPVGGLTPAFRTEQGVEMLAVCEKKERQDQISLRTRIEQEILQKRVEGSSSAYFNEIRTKAVIVR
ncbi:MAG: SurA N-terminal domain-containing protein [Beijerinckiaceae bacterium]